MNQVLETLEVLKYEEYWQFYEARYSHKPQQFRESIEQTTDQQSMTFA